MIEYRLEVSKKEAVSAFINKPSVEDYYFYAFEKFDKNGGVSKFQWHWSWWAFAGGVFYLLYRKLYKEAIILFAILLIGSILPPTNIFITIACGGFLPFLVYKKYQTSCETIANHNAKGDEALDALRWAGGVNQWAIVVAIVMHIYVAYIFINYSQEIQKEFFNNQTPITVPKSIDMNK